MVTLNEYRGLADFDSKRQRALESLLYRNEQFIYGIDVYDAIFFAKWRATKLVLTDQRIIAFKRRYIKETARDFELEDIVSIEHRKGYVFRRIAIEGYGVSKEFQTLGKVGRKFVTTVREQKNRRDNGDEPVSTLGKPIESEGREEADNQLSDVDASAESSGKFGSLKIHLIIAILTFWWTLGLANLIYIIYSYYKFEST